MAGKKKPLSAAQVVALKKVREQRARWWEAKATISAEVQAEIERRLADQELAYALAVREAHALDIPKSRIGTEGMLTKDPHTVERWLEKTAGLVAARSSEVAPTFRFDGQHVVVSYPDFPTTANVPGDDYPETLTGAVARDEKSPTGWIVTHDPDGEIGWFTWEITQVPASNPASLSAKINEWMQEQR